MTNERIDTYRERQNQIISEIDKMHMSSNWTQEMEERQEKMDNQIEWIRKRIENIEEMIGYNDDYYYSYINSQY